MTQIVCGCMIGMFTCIWQVCQRMWRELEALLSMRTSKKFLQDTQYMIRIPWQDDKGPMTRSSIGSTVFKLGWLLEGDKTPSDLFLLESIEDESRSILYGWLCRKSLNPDRQVQRISSRSKADIRSWAQCIARRCQKAMSNFAVFWRHGQRTACDDGFYTCLWRSEWDLFWYVPM